MQFSSRIASSLLLSLAFPTLAIAQGEFVALRGSTLPNGDALQFVRAYAVGDRGDWAADVQTDNPNLFGNTLVLVNGQIAIERGDLLGGGQGFHAVTWKDILVTEQGRVALAGIVDDGQSNFFDAVVVDGTVVLHEGQSVAGAGAGLIQSIASMSLGADNRLSAVVAFAPGGFGAPFGLIELDLDSPSPTPTLVLAPGQMLPGGSLLGSVRDAWRQDFGQVLTYATEVIAPGVQNSVLRLDGSYMLATGDPSPVPGETWNLETFLSLEPRFAVNDHGQVAVLARLSSGIGAWAVAVDNELVARVGQVMRFNGTSVLTQIDRMSFHLTETGQAMWFGHLNNTQPGLFVDDQPVLLTGMPAAGSTISHLYEITNLQLHPISDNGAFLLHWVVLTDGREGLMRWELGLGNVACGPAALNSTGAAARILVTGSESAGGEPLRLVATVLPPQRFGYFLTGTQGGSISPPGSQGTLCLAGPIGRFNARVQHSGAAGQFELDVDTLNMPVSSAAAVQAGETWLFQAWFRDANPDPTSNFTDAVAVTFQ